MIQLWLFQHRASLKTQKHASLLFFSSKLRYDLTYLSRDGSEGHGLNDWCPRWSRNHPWWWQLLGCFPGSGHQHCISNNQCWWRQISTLLHKSEQTPSHSDLVLFPSRNSVIICTYLVQFEINHSHLQVPFAYQFCVWLQTCDWVNGCLGFDQGPARYDNDLSCFCCCVCKWLDSF